MSEFFTWTSLATIAGATAATAYITQFLKKFAVFNKLNSQAVSYGVALVLLFLATFFTGGLTAATCLMIPLNAVIVAFSSNGAYDSVASTIKAIESAFIPGAGAADGNDTDLKTSEDETATDDKVTDDGTKAP